MFEPLDKSACCGCAACMDVCPKGIILPKSDELGFMTPNMSDPTACIDCDLCKRVCPGRARYERQMNVGEVCAVRAKDARLLDRSSSGGVFPVIARSVLRGAGVVYGASFDASFRVVAHRRVDDVEGLSALQGSKYVQSSMQGVYKSVARDLADGRDVLFCGTPCQVDALRLFLKGVDCTRLYAIDLFCYGVPSPCIWQQWLSKIEADHDGARVESVNFRDKTKGWQNYSLRIAFEDGSTYIADKTHDLFLGTFSKGAYLRESCYHCSHKGFPRGSDLTLGDFQEIDRIDPSLNSLSGISMVRVNTPKGYQLMEKLSAELDSHVVESHVMDSVHPGMGAPVPRDRRRDAMERHIGSWDVERLLRRYGRELAFVRVKRAIKRLLRRGKG